MEEGKEGKEPVPERTLQCSEMRLNDAGMGTKKHLHLVPKRDLQRLKKKIQEQKTVQVNN